MWLMLMSAAFAGKTKWCQIMIGVSVDTAAELAADEQRMAALEERPATETLPGGFLTLKLKAYSIATGNPKWATVVMFDGSKEVARYTGDDRIPRFTVYNGMTVWHGLDVFPMPAGVDNFFVVHRLTEVRCDFNVDPSGKITKR